MRSSRKGSRLRSIVLSMMMLVLAAGMFFTVKPRLEKYSRTVKVTAVVSACDSRRVHIDGGQDYRYDIYVNYHYEGKAYRDIFVKTRKNRMMVGNETVIRIDPEHPASPVQDNPYIMLIVAVGFAAFGLRYGIGAVFSKKTDPDPPKLGRH